jgi:aryl-alcohol dehydrogenase-like predicted oxidoreductase
MEYRRFGRTGLQVSVIGLGTGGPSRLGQRSGVPEPEAIKTVHRAIDLGVNLIDTAANYAGSEAILGRALKGVPRDTFILCTKFGPARGREDGAGPGELKAAHEMAESMERSLQDLGLDHVDVFQLHGVRPANYDAVLERFMPEARKLQEQGKTRFIGITENFGPSDDHHVTLTRALKDDLFDTMMVGYNLLSPLPEEHVLPEAQRRDVGILVMCAVRRAIANPEKLNELVKDLKARGELVPDALPDSGPLDWLVRGDVDSVSLAAYKFAAGHPGVSCVLTGTANQAHLEQNVAAVAGPPLPPEDRQKLLRLFGPIRRNLGN